MSKKPAKVSEERVKLLLIRAVVAQLPVEQQQNIAEYNQRIRRQVEAWGQEGKIAVRLAVAQWAAGI